MLQGLNLDVDAGDFVAFMGPSGSGKTTILNLLGGLDVPTHGSVRVAGDEITSMSVWKIDDVAGAARGICVSDVQFNSGADGVSKRGIAAAADEAEQIGAARARGGGAFAGGIGGPDETLSAATFRRTGTARGDCASDCDGSDIFAVRRADGRSGSQERGRSAGSGAAAGERSQENCADGDARSARGGTSALILHLDKGVLSGGAAGSARMKYLRLLRVSLLRKKFRTCADDRFVCGGDVFVWAAVRCAACVQSGSGSRGRRPTDRDEQISFIQPLPIAYMDATGENSGNQADDTLHLVRRNLSGREEFLSAVRD